MYGNTKHVFAVGDEEQQSEADTRAASQVCGDSLTSYTHSGMKNLLQFISLYKPENASFFFFFGLFNLK